MVEVSDLYNHLKTSLEACSLHPDDAHLKGYETLAGKALCDAAAAKSFTQVVQKFLQHEEKHLVSQLVDFLDYLTSVSATLWTPYVDDKELLNSLFTAAEKFMIPQIVSLLLAWEPHISHHSGEYYKRKCSMYRFPPLIETLNSQPKLKYSSLSPSDSQRASSAVSALLSTAPYATMPNSTELPASNHAEKLKDYLTELELAVAEYSKLSKESEYNDEDSKIFEDLITRLKDECSKVKESLEPVKKEQQQLPDSFTTSKSLRDYHFDSIEMPDIDPDIAASMMTMDELLRFKRDPCPNTDCPFKPSKEKSEKFKNKDLKCEFWHFDYDKRREVISFNDQTPRLNYHAKMCDKKGCRYKDKCFFSHTFFEAYYHPLFYKKFSCKENLNGECDQNHFCPYVHAKEEEKHMDRNSEDEARL